MRGLLLAGAASCALSLGAGDAVAQSFSEALANAYQNNPTLKAQRVRVRSIDENMAQAVSNIRPNVQVNMDIGGQWTSSLSVRGGSSMRVPTTPQTYEVDVTQPIFRGFRTVAEMNRARNEIQAERARLRSTEQGVLLEAVTAYVDVVRDAATLDLNRNNERVLQRQLEAAQDRFQVGEITRTDVSQAESRLALATADRIQSEGDLERSKAEFVRVIGLQPVNVEAPKVDVGMPGTLDDAVSAARELNPDVVASRFDERAANENIDVVKGELLPEVNLVGSASKTREQGGIRKFDRNTFRVIAEFSIPVYQQGAVYSQVRQAKQDAGQRRIEIEESRRQAVEDAVRAWEDLRTAQAQIRSFQTQVGAAVLALEGVRQESAVGSRTVLDVLDQEQELLDARVNLVGVQRDEVVAKYELLTAVGRLTAEEIGLPVDLYRPQVNYDEVSGKFFGMGSYPADMAGHKEALEDKPLPPEPFGPLSD